MGNSGGASLLRYDYSVGLLSKMLSRMKTMLAVFHLNNKEAKHELKVTGHFYAAPECLVLTLNRMFLHHLHLES